MVMLYQETPEAMEAAADLLERAADVLETEGWNQGRYESVDILEGTSTYCAVGAIRKVAGFGKLGVIGYIGRSVPCQLAYKEIRDKLPVINVITGELGPPNDEECCGSGLWVDMPVETWNDAPGRTAAEVIDLMKHAAKDLRNRKAA